MGAVDLDQMNLPPITPKDIHGVHPLGALTFFLNAKPGMIV